MNYSQPEHDREQRPFESEQFVQNNSEHGLDQTLIMGTHPGAGSPALQRISQGVMNGESPIQFMDAINADNSAMGNRAFLQFVGGLYQQHQTMDAHGIAKAGLKGPGRTLTHQNKIQQAFGHHDVSDMREHTGPGARTALTTLGAEGYASHGRMAIADTPDLYTQAHEAAHGVQQAALGDSLQLKGGIGEAGDRYETHADAVAEKVVRGESVEGLLDEVAGGPTVVADSPVTTATGPVQMMYTDKDSEDEEEDGARLMMTLMGHAIEVKKGGRWGRGRANPSRPSGNAEALAQATTKPQETKVGREMRTPAATPGPVKVKQKQPHRVQVGKEGAKQGKITQAGKGGAKKGGKLALDQMPGLRDMFLSRAINHLITGELHQLDSMVGDEGCQLRTPFTLDLYELVQDQLKESVYQSSAGDLVGEYRKTTDEEQTSVIERMKEIERMRVGSTDRQRYDDAMSEFIRSNALQTSVIAKSGLYEELFNYLMTAIEHSWPGAREYLEYLASETIFWGNKIDPFGVSMGPFTEPIFPDAILSKRKAAQAEYSKNYFVKALSELLRVKGIKVESKKIVAGYSKQGEEERIFEIPTSDPENILSMLLYSIQLCTATKPAKNKDLPLMQCWESLRSLIPMFHAKGRPIIVNLRRIISVGPEEEPVYTSDLCESLFYEPSPDGYRYQPNPSMEQQQQGAFVISGFSMLRHGDRKMREGGLNIAPWLFEEDPKKFKEGFTSAPVSKLIFIGGIKHPPLNVGAAGAKALALSPGESVQSGNKTKTREFGGSSENSFPYAEALHRMVLERLGQTGMTRAGQRWLTPDYQLTGAAKDLVFPDQCPIDITGSQPQAAMNIAEEFQLLLRLAEAGNQSDVRYAMDSREAPGEVIRLANQTIPFSIKHIYASTFQHENAISQRYARESEGVKAGRRHRISELFRNYH